MKRINIAIDERTGEFVVPTKAQLEDYIEEQFVIPRKSFKTIESFMRYAKSARDDLAAGIVPERIY